MPYIKKENRFIIRQTGEVPVMSNVGDLNYVLSQVCLKYLELFQEKYQTYNDIIGALESCKLELYRRKVSQYEDKKIDENGDIF